MLSTNADRVKELFTTYVSRRRVGYSHPLAVQAVHVAADDCDPAHIAASVELGAALLWLGPERIRSDADLVAKWRAAGSPV